MRTARELAKYADRQIHSHTPMPYITRLEKHLKTNNAQITDVYHGQFIPMVEVLVELHGKKRI